jgi:Zn finger protein HypA/HybF involved in hydrogenase expression
VNTHLDGNVLAGPLGDLFAIEVTEAVGKCAHCGASNAIGQSRVYADAPGLVARCPNCGAVVLRLVRSAGRAWLDMSGISCLQLQLPGE